MVKRSWDNANIIESYPAVCSPLTFSFARFIYKEVYAQTAGVFGYSPAFIRDKSRQLETLLGYHGGRFYYNLETWCELVAYLPGFADNPGVLQEMMGVRPEDRIEIAPKPLSFRQKIALLTRILGLYRGHARAVENWLEEFEENRQVIQGLLAGAKTADEAFAVYVEIEKRFLLNWRVPIINDIFTMIFSGRLRKWSRSALGHELDPKMLFSIGKSGNAEMVVRLRQIVELIRANVPVREAFLRATPSRRLHLLTSEKLLRESVEAFLRDFGLRNGHDLKLETPNIQEDPEALADIIAEYLHHSVESRGNSPESGDTSEALALQELRGLSLHKRMLGRWLMYRTREVVRHREVMRTRRSQAFGLVRQVFLILGKDFEARGLLQDRADIFMLETEEIFNVVRGLSTLRSLHQLVEVRRAEAKQYQGEIMPDHFQTKGIPSLSIPKPEKVQKASGELRGVPNYPAIVEGEVLVLDKPDLAAQVRGKIVVCPFTDPSWVPIMGLVKGLIVERGGLLSHAAIVSRELELPSILGVKGAVSTLKTGWIVRMDSTNGTVTVMRGSNG